MTEQEPRKVPIGYEDRPDKPTRGALRITALAIAAAAVVFLTLIAVVVMRSGGI